MATSPQAQVTDFTRDVLGRYICNGLDEAILSTTARPDSRPFDIVVIGGGSFGPALAQHLLARDQTRSHRILVLEAGPFLLPEHVQNLPSLGLVPPGPTTIAALKGMTPQQQRAWSMEVWGLAWHSSTPFPGLAYAMGGRSLYWGGWSPQLLNAEMPLSRWPSGTVNELNTRYFREASEQIGTNTTNDFISGKMHEAMRKQLFDGIQANAVTDAIPLAQLPLNLDVPPGTSAAEKELFKLEAPLAVQSSEERAGFFPFNKFSPLPLLMRAVRMAQDECGGDDVKKRLMVVPNCHVMGLATEDVSAPGSPLTKRVTVIKTNLGDVPIPPSGKVIIAMGTIESTRLALNSFAGIPNYNLIGKNLMAHLRSNLNIRIPRAALTTLDPLLKDLQASALFVKGQHTHTDGSVGHFHFQITAAGLGAADKPDSEAELFKKVPDIDGLDVFRDPNVNDQVVVITIRGIGEMEPRDLNNLNAPHSEVTLDPNRDPDEFGVPRAFVTIAPTAKDNALWDAMDKAADDVAKVFAGNQPLAVLSKQRDGLGTTHHEAGTLWMGSDPSKSVTNADGRFHFVSNAHVAGPALFPMIGSPNPMLTGIALVRRLGDQVFPNPPSDGFQFLFDGVTTNNWQMAGQGGFNVVGGALESSPGNDLGLFWCTTPMPANFILKLEWLLTRYDDNSGVFVRFPDPNSKGYNNTAYVGVDFGFEVQIDNLGRGSSPAGKNVDKKFRTTGAIYNEDSQTLTPQPVSPLGEWNEFEIRVQGQTYTVFLNGMQETSFLNKQINRGLPGAPNAPSFIGLQSHTGVVAFRNIRFKGL
jgi:choline dehydrogenase-like flavoprotein